MGERGPAEGVRAFYRGGPDAAFGTSSAGRGTRPEIRPVWSQNYESHGAQKVWRQLNREGLAVAPCTVEQLMRELDLRKVVRGWRVRFVTVPDRPGQKPALGS